MSASQRKDRAADEIISTSNPVMKRMNGVNSPYSPQATGLDKIPEANVTVPIDDLEPTVECIEGNRRGVIKTVTDDGGDPAAVTEVVITFVNIEGAEPEKDITYTERELEESSITFFKKQLPETINV